MWRANRRQVFKQTLSLTRVKILYSRITLTRVTTLYFFSAFAICVILSGLRAIAFTDNSQAITAIGTLIGSERMDVGLVVLEKRTLRYCSSIPNQPGTNCTDILTFGASDLRSRALEFGQNELLHIRVPHSGDADEDEDEDGEDDGFTKKNRKPTIKTTAASSTAESTVVLSNMCILSLRWLDETIRDAQREDVVTFVFQIWLFVLAIVTILNQSIPHLLAGLFGHVLGTAWSGYRIKSTMALKYLYQGHIVPEACNNQDFIGDWWDIRTNHAIPVVLMNCVALIALCTLSFKLYIVYANESFSRVGASTQINRMYKLVLVFSVCLQLSGFFSIASTAMWIDKICHGAVMQLAHHSKFYLAAFIITLVLSMPWFYLGWVCVRKECKFRFWTFIVMAVFLLTISTLMFSSPLYRFIFTSWPLFGTMTVTAYVLTLATTILAILCRLNFGKGLAHYLQVTDALEGMDFTPIFLSENGNSDPEKYDYKDDKYTPMGPVAVHLPPMAFAKPKNHRGSSIYSDSNATSIYLSSSPPLVSELTPAPNRLSRAATKRAMDVPYPAMDSIAPPKPVAARRSKALSPIRTNKPRSSFASSHVSIVGTTSSSSSVNSIPVSVATPTSPVPSFKGSVRKQGLPANPRSKNASPVGKPVAF